MVLMPRKFKKVMLRNSVNTIEELRHYLSFDRVVPDVRLLDGAKVLEEKIRFDPRGEV